MSPEQIEKLAAYAKSLHAKASRSRDPELRKEADAAQKVFLGFLDKLKKVKTSRGYVLTKKV